MVMTFPIMFYNLENLYDTIKDPDKQDTEFTPVGSKRWDDIKYRIKLRNLSEVFNSVAKAYGSFPVVVGMSEVENKKVLEDLADQKMMSGASYKAIHYESGDLRGVDVGMFYRPDKFKLIGSEPVKLVLRSGREYTGRDILCAWGELDGEMFCFYICHFLSRRAGVDSSAGFRRAGAETVREHAVRMADRYPGIKIVVMGDMNDEPYNESLAIKLKARRNIHNVGEDDYFNPFWLLCDEHKGTSMHNHRWCLYDNIIVSRNLLENGQEKRHSLKLSKIDKTHYGEIFCRKFMISKGRPKRCFEGDTFVSGYSDHLPVIIKLYKAN